MIRVTKHNCCGCTACASSCPKGSISMVSDALGFLYPVIDDTTCINCGVCSSVCQFNKLEEGRSCNKPKSIFAARCKDSSELLKSQSGGAFKALSDCILEEHGVVYGACYDESFNVVHRRASSREERDKMRGSKYVQSNLSGIFDCVKKDLESNKKVLFTGTPCQIDGLKAFLKGKYNEMIYYVDLICHGVPAPSIWRDYLRYLENKYHGSLVQVNNRDKRFGWNSCEETYLFKENMTSLITGEMWYKDTYFENLMTRYSCSECPYCSICRPGDITIGDFWGYEKTELKKVFDDNKGCSLVIINTSKGENLFKKASLSLDYYPISEDECLQPNLISPTKQHPRRNQFEDDYMKHGFRFVHFKYNEGGPLHHAKNELIRTLVRIKRLILK